MIYVAEKSFGSRLIKFNHFPILLTWVHGIICDREEVIEYDVSASGHTHTYGPLSLANERSQGNSDWQLNEIIPSYRGYLTDMWTGKLELKAVKALLELRKLWQGDHHPLALLSGMRGTAHQAWFVREQIEQYGIHMGIDHADYECKGESCSVLGVLAEWASLLLITTIARRGNWTKKMPRAMRDFCMAGETPRFRLPTPFDPHFTSNDTLESVAARLTRLTHFGSFLVFINELRKVCDVPYNISGDALLSLIMCSLVPRY